MSSQGNTIEFTQDEVRYFKVGIQAQLAKYDDLKIERFGVKPNLNELYPNDPLRNVAKMHTAIIYQAFWDTVEGEETGKNTEDYVGRYVNMLLIRNFCILDFGWNIVPQYYTKSSKFPDLVLETWRPLEHGKTRENNERKNTNVPRVYIELKSVIGTKEIRALDQAREAVSLQYGKPYPAQGIIIVIRGFIWLFMEYQFGRGIHKTGLGHKTEPDAVRIKLMAFDHKEAGIPTPKNRPARPNTVPIGSSPNAQTGDGYQLDMRKEEDEKHCLQVLRWISITRAGPGHIRDIAKVQGYGLPSEVTSSTLRASLDVVRLNEPKNAGEDENDEVSIQDPGLRADGLRAMDLVDILDKYEEDEAIAGASR